MAGQLCKQGMKTFQVIYMFLPVLYVMEYTKYPLRHMTFAHFKYIRNVD